MHLHVWLYIYLCRCSPSYNNARAVVCSLEVADVLAERFYHFPTRSTLLHVVAIQTLSEILVKRSLERYNLLKLVLNGHDILLLQHLSIHGALEGISRIYIPCTEDNVVQLCHRNNL